jgi:predicted DNA-binding WGR domain protein
MGTHHYQFYCQRIDASRNMARYYALAIRPTLFGETAVVRSWGRIGRAGGEMTEVFGTEKDAISRFLELVLQKRKRGYKPARNCGNTKRITIPQTSVHDNVRIG